MSRSLALAISLIALMPAAPAVAAEFPLPFVHEFCSAAVTRPERITWRGVPIGRANSLPPVLSQPSDSVCDGCPQRSVGRAFLDTTLINVIYGLANLARGQVTAEVTPKTWWTNMQQGWVWDLDDFGVNQIGHPYQGNNYFNAARAHGRLAA